MKTHLACSTFTPVCEKSFVKLLQTEKVQCPFPVALPNKQLYMGQHVHLLCSKFKSDAKSEMFGLVLDILSDQEKWDTPSQTFGLLSLPELF